MTRSRDVVALPVRGALAAAFLRSVAADPRAVAVRDDREELTRADLSFRAAALAARLDDGSRDPVLLATHDGVAMVTALLAANAVGRPLVVAGWATSAEARRAVVERTGATAQVGPPRGDGSDDDVALTVPVGDEADARSDRSTDVAWRDTETAARLVAPAPGEEPDGTGTCVIITTSGSTGPPKPLTVSDDGVVREGASAKARPDGPWPGDRLALPTAGSAAVVLALGRALAEGVTTSIVDPLRLAPQAFLRLLDAHGVTVLRIPASLLRRVARSVPAGEQLPTLRSVSVFGEALLWSDVAVVRERLSPRAEVVTAYGVSEGGRVTVRAVAPDEPIGEGPVGVGRPIPGRRVWIDAGDGRPAPSGVAGEIVVEGRLHRTGPGIEELADGEARARPGDRGRLEPDGTLTLLGRLDRMVKISALRVEPDRVEDALLSVPGVLEAAVVPLEVAPGEVRLVAHVAVVPGATVTPADLIAAVTGRLPSAAVPVRIELREGALPTLASGKLDRRAVAAGS